MKKRRNWLLILVGVAVLMVFVGIGLVIAVTAWVQQNVHVEERAETDAKTEFEKVRQRYAGKPPLLQFTDDRPTFTAGTAPPDSSPRQSLSNMHVLVWAPDGSRLVSLAVPFWLLRLKSSPIQFSQYASGLDDQGVTVRTEDIERYGPGVILDAERRGEVRVLIWAE